MTPRILVAIRLTRSGLEYHISASLGSRHIDKLTNKIDNAVCNAQRASGLDTATDILDVGAQLLSCLLTLELSEVNLGEVGEAGNDVLSDQRLWVLEVALLGNLDLKLAATKVEVENLFNTSGLGRGLSDFVLGDLVATSDTEVNATL